MCAQLQWTVLNGGPQLHQSGSRTAFTRSVADSPEKSVVSHDSLFPGRITHSSCAFIAKMESHDGGSPCGKGGL